MNTFACPRCDRPIDRDECCSVILLSQSQADVDQCLACDWGKGLGLQGESWKLAVIRGYAKHAATADQREPLNVQSLPDPPETTTITERELIPMVLRPHVEAGEVRVPLVELVREYNALAEPAGLNSTNSSGLSRMLMRRGVNTLKKPIPVGDRPYPVKAVSIGTKACMQLVRGAA